MFRPFLLISHASRVGVNLGKLKPVNERLQKDKSLKKLKPVNGRLQKDKSLKKLKPVNNRLQKTSFNLKKIAWMPKSP